MSLTATINQSKTRHLFGDLYEQILKDLQSAGNAGEFYTPRAVTQFAVDMVNPRLDQKEKVLDPACGTGGFLTDAYEHLKQQAKSPKTLELAKGSIFGVEKQQLPHLLSSRRHAVWRRHQDPNQGEAAAGLQSAYDCAVAQWGVQPLHQHSHECFVLHEGGANDGGLVLRASLSTGLQVVLKDEADDDSGV